MSKVTTLLNRIFVFVIFLLSCTRVAVTRIFPSSQPSPNPPNAKVFALTEAAWLELRGVSADQDKGESKSGDDKKKDASPSGDEKKKDAPKSADCDKGPKSADEKKGTPPSNGDKKKDASPSGECEGPGGGDGDVGGTGG